MLRLGQIAAMIATLTMVLGTETGCSSGHAINTTGFAIPATIALVPAGSASMELGTSQQFAATPEAIDKSPITEPVFFQSSNSSVATVAANGLVCAGTWDSLSVPQICSPGGVGFADITAVAQGVSSPATRVYVHQHIDNIVISPVPPAPISTCLTATANAPVQHEAAYQARAYSRGVDITNTAGQFIWQVTNAAVASTRTSAPNLVNFFNGQSLNQVEVTATVPGETPIYAFVGNATSLPFSFTTCLVQSIGLQLTGSTGEAQSITPTITDTSGTLLKNAPLTWSSSQSAAVTASDGSATAISGGSATVIASCTPPTCNVGLLPTVPIFPENVVTLTGQPSGSSAATLYVSSTACGTIDACVSTLIQVTNPPVKLGPTAILPATPDSLRFNHAGTKAYLGTDFSLLGSKGIAVIDVGASTVTGFSSAPGKILAISPDDSKVLVSDTKDFPNQVYVFDSSTNAATAFRIAGATAADFSPDSLKAFIVAGSTLYIYSKLDALQAKALTAPANDVSFLSEGAFAYLAGGDPAGVTVKRTCDNGQADTVPVPAIPTFLKTLPDATGIMAILPPEIGEIHVAASPTGCNPTVTDSLTTFNLGRGNFTASQLIVSPDGTAVYVVSPDFNSILVFNVSAQTSSAIPLSGTGHPLSASLTSDGTQLFVGSSDGTVHLLQITTGSDVEQISFPPPGICQTSSGQTFPGITCNPDLVAVKP